MAIWITVVDGAVLQKPIQSIHIDGKDLPTNAQNMYKQIEEFFNTVFAKSMKLTIDDGSVKTIEGLITYQGEQQLTGVNIVTVTIQDISIADGPSKMISASIYTDKTSFPINFSIKVNENEINPWASYSLSVEIWKNNNLEFITTYRTDILVDGKIVPYPILVAVDKVSSPEPSPPKLLKNLHGVVMLKNGPSFQSIPDGAEIEVEVVDSSIADLPNIVMGKQVFIASNLRFPFEYSVDYDASRWKDFPQGSYQLQIRITCQNNLIYVNDEQHLITNDQCGLLSELNANVTPLPLYVPDTPVEIPTTKPVPVTPAAPTIISRAFIKGELNCNGNLCTKNLIEAGNQQLTINIRDVSIMDRSSKLIAEKVINLTNPWQFPLNYDIEFDASEIIHSPGRSYAISARITKVNDGKLSFITDERNDIVDSETLTIRPTINMHVVRT